jgi:hypothetical protein
MPRLRDRTVLNEGIVDMPMLWDTDAFALATDFDTNAPRYIGLWIPGDKNAAPAATDAVLLVRPDVALKQREAEEPEPGPGPGPAPGPGPHPPGPAPGPKPPPPKTRFYGVKTLNADKIALEFKTIADEVLTHFREAGTDLVVKIEIEARDPAGFDDAQVRTVSENTKTLKFDQSGFEEN